MVLCYSIKNLVASLLLCLSVFFLFFLLLLLSLHAFDLLWITLKPHF